jgi:hypothetical protein
MLSMQREAGMAHQPDHKSSAQPAHNAIAALTDAFCQKHLNDEYGVLCRRLVDALARKRPSPISRGKPDGWSSGIVRVIGWVNFLGDPCQTPHLKSTDIDRGFGVSPATGHAKAMAIRKLLKIQRLDPEWTLPSRVGDNPLAWLIQVNGVPVDARSMPRKIQEEAYRKGLIPFLPSEVVSDAADEDQPEEVSGTGMSRTSTADAAVLVGELHLRQGEYVKAIAAFTQAIENSPTADAYQGRAKAHRGLAEIDEQKARDHAAQDLRRSSPKAGNR